MELKESRLIVGDILVSVDTGKGLFSMIKRWALGTKYKHCFLYLGRMGLFAYRGQRRILRVPMIFESIGRGVCLRLLSERYGEKVVVMRLKSEYDRRRIPYILRAAIELASDSKSYYDFFCIPLHIIPRILHEKLGMPIPLKYQRNEQQICSESVREVCIRGRLVDILPARIVPLPGDFVTDSPLLEEVQRGDLSAEWV